MKNNHLKRAVAFALATIVACGALTGCAVSKGKKPSVPKPQNPVTQQEPQKPEKEQKPGLQVPQKPEKEQKPGLQVPQKPEKEQKPSQTEAKSKVDKIEKTATDKLVDTYTIAYKDGNTSTFTVTYSIDSKEISKIECVADEQGHAPAIEIKNGIWHIDGVATGIEADDIRTLIRGDNDDAADKDSGGKNETDKKHNGNKTHDKGGNGKNESAKKTDNKKPGGKGGDH